jgi:hypothetical protein
MQRTYSYCTRISASHRRRFCTALTDSSAFHPISLTDTNHGRGGRISIYRSGQSPPALVPTPFLLLLPTTTASHSPIYLLPASSDQHHLRSRCSVLAHLLCVSASWCYSGGRVEYCFSYLGIKGEGTGFSAISYIGWGYGADPLDDQLVRVWTGQR